MQTIKKIAMKFVKAAALVLLIAASFVCGMTFTNVFENAIDSSAQLATNVSLCASTDVEMESSKISFAAIEATVTPSDVALTWTAHWSDGIGPSDGSAPTDYITIEAQDELSHTVLIVMKQYFGDEITLRAETEGGANDSVRVTCASRIINVTGIVLSNVNEEKFDVFAAGNAYGKMTSGTFKELSTEADHTACTFLDEEVWESCFVFREDYLSALETEFGADSLNPDMTIDEYGYGIVECSSASFVPNYGLNAFSAEYAAQILANAELTARFASVIETVQSESDTDDVGLLSVAYTGTTELSGGGLANPRKTWQTSIVYEVTELSGGER